MKFKKFKSKSKLFHLSLLNYVMANNSLKFRALESFLFILYPSRIVYPFIPFGCFTCFVSWTVYMRLFSARLPGSWVKEPRSRQAGQLYCSYKRNIQFPAKSLYRQDLGKRDSPVSGLAPHPYKQPLRAHKTYIYAS